MSMVAAFLSGCFGRKWGAICFWSSVVLGPPVDNEVESNDVSWDNVHNRFIGSKCEVKQSD